MIREMIRQVVTAALIGAVATVGHYATLVLLVEILSVNPVAGSLTGFVVGGLIGYPLNRRVTFRSDRSHAVAAPSFFAIAGVAFALDGVLMAFFIELLGRHPGFVDFLVDTLGRIPGFAVLVRGRDYLIAQVLTTLILFAWTFSANRFWTFRKVAAIRGTPAAPSRESPLDASQVLTRLTSFTWTFRKTTQTVQLRASHQPPGASTLP